MVTQADGALLALTGVVVLLALIVDYCSRPPRRRPGLDVVRLTVADLRDGARCSGWASHPGGYSAPPKLSRQRLGRMRAYRSYLAAALLAMAALGADLVVGELVRLRAETTFHPLEVLRT